METSHDLPRNRCLKCRRQRRKVGLYCRLCYDAARKHHRECQAAAIAAGWPENPDGLRAWPSHSDLPPSSELAKIYLDALTILWDDEKRTPTEGT